MELETFVVSREIIDQADLPDKGLAENIGKIAIVGNFGTLSNDCARYFAAKTTAQLYARGIIGNQNHLGIQIVGPQPRSEEKEEGIFVPDELVQTAEGIKKNIKSRNKVAKELNMHEVHLTNLTDYSDKYYSVDLPKDDTEAEPALKVILQESARNFEEHLAETGINKSLLIVTTADIGHAISQSVTKNDLEMGGIATLDRTKVSDIWLPWARASFDMNRILNN